MSALAASAPKIFRNLEKYSTAEVELLNWFQRTFAAGANWRHWIADGVEPLLEVPGPLILTLSQSNQTEAGPVRESRYQQDEIRIGRDSDKNDLVLGPRNIGREHARIFKKDQRLFIEDLESANGTYLNDRKLVPGEAAPLANADRFRIFPYLFTVAIEQTWIPGPSVRLCGPHAHPTTWKAHQAHGLRGFHCFSVRVYPIRKSAALAITRPFLDAIVRGIARDASVRVPSDRRLLELCLLSVLERANEQLQFPYHFLLSALDEPAPDEPGIAVECVIEWMNQTGVVRLFLPADLLEHFHPIGLAGFSANRIPLRWRLLVSAGHAVVGTQDLSELEIGDILLFEPNTALLLPQKDNGVERGWRVTSVHATDEPHRLRLDAYFERNFFMDSESANEPPGQRPDLTTLPVRVHVVLGQVELNFAELNTLAPGSIIELDRGQNEPVQLVVNGQIAGTGALVEVDGKLGVRISEWLSQ